jgi:hypothetical protein
MNRKRCRELHYIKIFNQCVMNRRYFSFVFVLLVVSIIFIYQKQNFQLKNIYIKKKIGMKLLASV